jgi:PAS domain-containing protein
MKPPNDLLSGAVGAVTPDFPAAAIFASATSAVLLVEQASGRVVEANGACARLLALRRAELLGSDWLAAFDPACARQLDEARVGATLQPFPPELALRSRTGGAHVRATITLFRIGSDAYLLVRLLPAHVSAAAATPAGAARVLDELEATPVGFVVTNRYFHVDYCNRAFLDLVCCATSEEAQGQSLARWLALTEHDLQRLRDQVSDRQATIVILTALHAGPAAGRSVELTAVAVPDATAPCWGFTLRVP